MDRVCIRCGRPLAEGEVCHCGDAENTAGSTQDAAQNAAQDVNQNTQDAAQNTARQNGFNQGQPNFNQNGFNQGRPDYNQGPYQQPKQPSKVEIFYKRAVAAYKAVVTHPMTEGARFAKSGDVELSVAYIILQALVTGLFVLAFTINIYSLIVELVASLAGGMSYFFGGYASSYVTVPFGKMFIGSLLLSGVLSVLFALCIYVFGQIVKNNMTFRQSVCVAALRSVLITPVMLVGLVVTFAQPMLALLVYFSGNILAYLAVFEALPGEDRLADKNKRVFAYFLTMLVYLLIFAAALYIGGDLMIPSELSSLLNY